MFSQQLGAEVIVTIFKVLGSLGVFLYGMRVMSDGIQKTAGRKMQAVLNYMTRNRVVAVLSGFLITSLIQSSSATTVMVVSFVNAGLLNLIQGIGIIFGANIGTTITTWIVSFIGFKFSISAIALPIVGVGLPFIFSKLKRRRDFGEILVGFGLLFLGLMFLKDSVPDIQSHPEALEFLAKYTNLGFLSVVIFILAGSLLTAIMQSSSASMAVTVTMAYLGWIDYYTATAIVLGENIGTTITAYLAALGTNVNARRTARAHFFFNLFGVIWVSAIFRYFSDFVLFIAPWDTTLQINFPLNIALFHSCFNIANTILFLPFLTQFARFIEFVVPAKESDLNLEYSFKYISSGIQDTADLSIIEAKKEIVKMDHVAVEMFDLFLDIFYHPTSKMGDKVKKIKCYEELTDKMQLEISKFLVDCSQDDLSESNMRDVSSLIRIVNGIENIGDSCFKLTLIVQRRYDERLCFHAGANEEIQEYSKMIREYFDFACIHLNERLTKDEFDYAMSLERNIDRMRDDLRLRTESRIKSGADAHSELLYLDLLKNYEHIGDYCLNIAQALARLSD